MNSPTTHLARRALSSATITTIAVCAVAVLAGILVFFCVILVSNLDNLSFIGLFHLTLRLFIQPAYRRKREQNNIPIPRRPMPTTSVSSASNINSNVRQQRKTPVQPVLRTNNINFSKPVKPATDGKNASHSYYKTNDNKRQSDGSEVDGPNSTAIVVVITGEEVGLEPNCTHENYSNNAGNSDNYHDSGESSSAPASSTTHVNHDSSSSGYNHNTSNYTSHHDYGHSSSSSYNYGNSSSSYDHGSSSSSSNDCSGGGGGGGE
jgi:uncharacterized membrane protein YgcG